MSYLYENGWHTYKRSLMTTRRAGAVSKDIEAYFFALDYELVATTPTLVFQRGSVLGGILNANPAAYRTQISIDVVTGPSGETLLEITRRVSGFFNLHLAVQDDFHQAELDGLQVLLEYGYLDTQRSQYAAERAVWVMRFLVLALLASLLLIGLMALALLGIV